MSSTDVSNSKAPALKLSERFRGYMPVVVDVETTGFYAHKHALLEIAFVPIGMNEHGELIELEPISHEFMPADGLEIDPESLKFTGIDLDCAERQKRCVGEAESLKHTFKQLTKIRRSYECKKCILVGHNAHFDLAFLNAAIERNGLKNQTPFHPFSVLDTVTLAAASLGQTVLARACSDANIEFDGHAAHSALYDTQKTAELFCKLLNQTSYRAQTP